MAKITSHWSITLKFDICARLPFLDMTLDNFLGLAGKVCKNQSHFLARFCLLSVFHWVHEQIIGYLEIIKIL